MPSERLSQIPQWLLQSRYAAIAARWGHPLWSAQEGGSPSLPTLGNSTIQFLLKFFLIFDLVWQKRQKVEPVLYMTEWFLCAFTRTLPWSTVLRVWDMFLFEGKRYIWQHSEQLFNTKNVAPRSEGAVQSRAGVAQRESSASVKAVSNHV